MFQSLLCETVLNLVGGLTSLLPTTKLQEYPHTSDALKHLHTFPSPLGERYSPVSRFLFSSRELFEFPKSVERYWTITAPELGKYRKTAQQITLMCAFGVGNILHKKEEALVGVFPSLPPSFTFMDVTDLI